MGTLDAKQRASLPDRDFAYIDSKGKRKLPLNDESHVRNALARFNQVSYESDEARERAFRKVLKAASKYGIAPVGFVTRRLREARGAVLGDMPSGLVTLMMTDIEGSTRLAHDLGDAYSSLLEDVRGVIRGAVAAAGGYEVDARADEFFAAFAAASDAVSAAIRIQRTMDPNRARVRIGLHSGSPAVTDTGYVGVPVHVAARVCSAGHGGQILISSATRDELAAAPVGDVRLRSLGLRSLHGVPEPMELLQIDAEGLGTSFPSLRLGGPR